MSTPFTAIAAGADLTQSSAVINEIVTGIKERWTVSGTGGVLNAVVNGQDVSSVSFWRTLQNSAHTASGYFFDHANLSAGTLPLPFYTMERFCEVLGLPMYYDRSPAWRRATAWTPGSDWRTDVAFSYGPMQSGDIIGPWIMEDLQNALKAQQWTRRTPLTSFNGGYINLQAKTASASHATYATAVSNLSSAWSSASWVSNTTYNFMYAVRASHDYGSSTGWKHNLTEYRYRGTVVFGGFPPSVPCALDVYYMPKLDRSGTVANVPIDGGLGFAYGAWNFLETLASSNSVTRQTTWSSPTEEPYPLCGFSTSIMGSLRAQDTGAPTFGNGFLGVAKWDFSNA